MGRNPSDSLLYFVVVILSIFTIIYVQQSPFEYPYDFYEQGNFVGAAVIGSGGAWREDFNGNLLNTNFWRVSNWDSGEAILNNHKGVYQTDRVSVKDGYLILRLTQENGPVGTNSSGVISRGGEIYTKNKYGYGTYEIRMRVALTSPTPLGLGVAKAGSKSSALLYYKNSQTEIDFIVEGKPSLSNWLEMMNWKNPDSAKPIVWPDSYVYRTYTGKVVNGMIDGFKTYKWVWSSGKIEFYVDGVLMATHTTNVPSAAGFFILNLKGTNKDAVGGFASVGVNRYMYVDWASFTPLGATPQVQACTNECSLSGIKQCSGTSGYQVCGNYDSDSCLEWSQVSACESLTTCQNGECVSVCSNNPDPCSPSGFVSCYDSTHQMTCGDYYGDACTEWGGVVACAPGQVCNVGVGCTGTPTSQVCGNGVREGTESCDDGNTNNNDVCKNDCTINTCSQNPDPCYQDGYIACYDNNNQMRCGNFYGDACLEWGDVRACTSGTTCATGTGCPTTSPPAASCGDGICNGAETCSACSQDCGACPPPQDQSRCTTPASGWCDNFDTFDTGRWYKSNFKVNVGTTSTHDGYMKPYHVSVENGYLKIKLSQRSGTTVAGQQGVISEGGEIGTGQRYGYGIYEFRMRMGSTSSTPTGACSADPYICNPSGSVSAAFNYASGSETELDFEVEGQFPERLELTTWNYYVNPDRRQHTSIYNFKAMSSGFKTYKMVWCSDRVEYYADGVLQATHRDYPPRTAAPYLFSLWGTNSAGFGGIAKAVGTDRYLYVDWVKFTPLSC